MVFDIDPDFEIQTLMAPPPAIATQLNLQLPEGFTALRDWRGPSAVRSSAADGHPVYIGKAIFTREVHMQDQVKPGPYPLECAVRYQACQGGFCLRPMEHTLAIAVEVQG